MLKIKKTEDVLEMSLRGYTISRRAYIMAMRVAKNQGIEEIKDSKDFFDLFISVSQSRTHWRTAVELAIFNGLMEAFEYKILDKDFVLSSAYLAYNALFFGDSSPIAQYYGSHCKDAQALIDKLGAEVNLK